MSPQIRDKVAYCDTLAGVFSEGKWADIDGFFQACIQANVFDVEFRERAFEVAAKAKIRRDIKSGLVTTADGRAIRPASILLKDSTGRVRRVYKDEEVLDVSDCIQVIRYWRNRRKYCTKRVRYYTKLAKRLHGDQVQSFLPLRD